MALSIEDLFTAPDAPTVRASMVTNLVSLGVPSDKWVSGGVASTMLTVVSIVIALFAAALSTIIQGFFLPKATGTGLKLLARYLYGITIPDPTFATGSVTLTNSGGATYTIPIGGYSALNPTTKITYTNTTAFVLGPTTSLSIAVAATTVGSAGNSASGTITQSVTSLTGVTVTNPAALVGVDAPSDPTIRILCLNKLGALSVRGVRTAYAYAVQTAVNSITGAPVNINRWSITSSSHTGTVTTIVAAPSGAPDPNDVTGVATNIEAIARPEAVTAIVSGATPIAYTRALTISCILPTGVTAAAAKTAIDNNLIQFIATYPVGGVLATDDANPSSAVQGLFGSGIYGIIAESIAAFGGKMISAQGATDLILIGSQVATNNITTTVRVIAPTSGTTVV